MEEHDSRRLSRPNVSQHCRHGYSSLVLAKGRLISVSDRRARDATRNALLCSRGNYDTFVSARVERLKNQQREYEAQKDYRDHIQIFINRFRYNANRAAQVQSKLKLLDKL